MPATIYVEKTDRRGEFTLAVLQRFTNDILVRNPRKILVKATISVSESYPTTTHPEVLEAVLFFLKRFHVPVVVGDAPGGDSLAGHPLNSACNTYGIELTNLQAHGYSRVKTENGFNATVSSLAMGCEYVVSLPVLRAHGKSGLTGALKNQLRLVHSRDRLMMRSRFLKDMHRSIAEVNSVVRPHVIIMDAVRTYRYGHELRSGAQEIELGYMLAGDDPLALDCHGLKLLGNVDPALAGKKPEDIPHLAWAARLNIGSTEYKVSRAFFK